MGFRHAETEAALLARLRAAAQRPPSSEALRRQRVSYVFGNLEHDDPMSRDQVAAILAALDGEPG